MGAADAASPCWRCFRALCTASSYTTPLLASAPTVRLEGVVLLLVMPVMVLLVVAAESDTA